MKLILKPSTRKNKKWMVILPNNKIVYFGGKGMSDYTVHKDLERKKLYIGRHKKLESKFWTHNKKNLRTPSYWSRYLLWENTSLLSSIKFIERKQNVKIVKFINITK